MGRTRKSAPEAVVEDDAFEELDDLETVDEDEDTEVEAPKAKRGKAAASDKRTKAASKADGASEFNTAWLANHVNEVTGVDVDSRSLRMLLRKMAANDELSRVVGEDRGRYTFPKGPNDPTVKLVLRKVKAGELQAAKREGLDKVKGAKKTQDTEEVAEAPAKKTRSKGAKAATATKATPSAGRRRRSAPEA